MKLDGEQVPCRGPVDSKSNSNPFVIGIKSVNVIVNEDQDEAFYDSKVGEENAGQLLYPVNNEDGWDGSKLDSCMNVNEPTHDSEKEVRDFSAPISLTHASLKSKSIDKDSVCYIDKNVMEPELPDVVVCYKENTYHVVKDICVDDGVPSSDKLLFDTGVDDKKLCTFLMPGKDINRDLDMSNPCLYENELSLKCDSKELLPPSHECKEVFSLGELLLIPEVGVEVSQSETLLNGSNEAVHPPIQGPNENRVSATLSSCEQPRNSTEQALLVTPTVDSVAEESGRKEVILAIDTPDCAHAHYQTGLLSCPLDIVTDESVKGTNEEKLPSLGPVSVSESTCTIGDELPCHGKAEDKGTRFDFNSSATLASGGEKGSQNGGSKHLESARVESRNGDTGTETFSGQLQYNPGESSFSAAAPLSGLVSYSGPIAYSGSLSLRSDSSTTSTRSFAFPILQSEWSSSPVRMAKADRRHFRKHRSWGQSLLCCRF